MSLRLARRVASIGLTLAVAASSGCSDARHTAGRPLHAPANFDPSIAGFVACSRLIAAGDVVSVTPVGARMITELAVSEWVKPDTGPNIARIDSPDIAADGVYEHWKPGQHLFLQIDADPAALPSWQFRGSTIKLIRKAVPEARALTCPYGTTESPFARSGS